MNRSRVFTTVSIAALLTLSTFRDVGAEHIQNVSRTLNHNSIEDNVVARKKTFAGKKSYVTKNTHQRIYKHDEKKKTSSSNLCPCHLNSGQGSRCYDFMNQAAGTCRMRPCTDGFVCSSRSYATHYCFEKTKYVTKVISTGGGRCVTKKEWLTFRMPYVDIVPRGDEREKELNYNTLIRDDVDDLEPDACFV